MQLARINIWHCFWFLGQGVLFSTLPWKTNPKQDVQIFSHLNIYFKEFLTSCVCLHFLPCCYFITQARLYMKRLRDHSEATKQTNVLPIQLHPACYSTARLGEGFRSTEGVTSSYLHTVFSFLGLGKSSPHTHRFTGPVIPSSTSMNHAKICKFSRSFKGRNLKSKSAFHTQIKYCGSLAPPI